MESSINLNIEDVKDFLVANNGKVKNAILVLHFKKYFNDPVAKASNKERFKDIVNKLAVVKTENGEKYIHLKKKFRPLPSLDSITSLDSQTSVGSSLDSEFSSLTSTSESHSRESSIPSSREESMEPIAGQSNSTQQSHGGVIDQSVVSVESGGYDADASRESSIAPEDGANTEESPIVSVKDRAKVINKMSEKPPEPKDYRMLGKIGKTQKMLADEVKTLTVSLIDPVEHEWMLVSAKCDYMRMTRMLADHPELARRKDYNNGYSGLHWACKHGNSDAIKLLAGSYQTPVNCRSHGGYTPLHIAAMHNNDDIIDLLVKAYGADINIRDFSGKKPKQYLRNSASRHIQRRQCYVGEISASDVMDGSKRSSRVTVEDVDAAIKRAGSDSSHQGIGSFFNPQMSSLRHSFRINKGIKNKENNTATTAAAAAGQHSPTMTRRASSKDTSSGEASSKKSKKNKGGSRPISEPPVSIVHKSDSDTDLGKKGFFV